MTIHADFDNNANFLDMSGRTMECTLEDNNKFKHPKLAVSEPVPDDYKHIMGAWRSPEWVEENTWDGF